MLTIRVREEPVYSGLLTFGLGYEDGTGVFGSLGVRLDDALGNGSTIRGRLTWADEFTFITGSISNPSFWGSDRAGGVRADFRDFRYDDTLFNYSATTLSPFLSFELSERARGEVRLSALYTEIDDIEPSASPLILTEDGERSLIGPGISLVFGSRSGEPRAWAVRLDQDLFFGDAEISRTELSFAGQTPFVGQSLLRTRVELGTVQSLGSKNTSTTDRYTLGGASMRGFARGGISPRDICLGCGAGGTDLVTDVGGIYFAVARTELILPLFRNQPNIEPFLFADIGSAWEVDSDVAPAGTLDESSNWRTSAGIGVSVSTQLGRFAASWSPHIDGRPFDDESEFQLTFTNSF